MIGKTIWCLLLAGLAYVSFAVQMDRQSMVQPAFADAVPAGFHSASAIGIAQEALQSGTPEVALGHAQRLVSDRPMPADHLMLLGQAQLAAGQAEQGVASIETAARRGWRVVPAQLAVADAAIAQGNYAAAANRLAAAMAVRHESPAIPALLQQMHASAEGRAAMSAALAGEGYWQRSYAAYALISMSPLVVWDTMMAAEAQGAVLRCIDLELVQRSFRSLPQSAPDLPERCEG